MSFDSSNRLIPVPAWPKYHIWPSVSGLRWLIFNADRNGFNTVVKRAGNRVLICEKSFFEWVEKSTNKNVNFEGGENDRQIL